MFYGLCQMLTQSRGYGRSDTEHLTALNPLHYHPSTILFCCLPASGSYLTLAVYTWAFLRVAHRWCHTAL